MRRLRAVIFDMDGVLVNSEPVYLELFSEFFRRNGRSVCREELVRTVGTSSQETWRILACAWGWTEDPMELRRFYRESCQDMFVPYGEVAFPEMRKTLEALSSKGFSLCIASASARASIQRMMRETGITPSIAHVVSGEDVAHSKPAPDVYLKAISLLGLPPENCVAVEDSQCGIQAAKAAGLRVIGVRSQLEPDSWKLADTVIEGIAELDALLEETDGTNRLEE